MAVRRPAQQGSALALLVVALPLLIALLGVVVDTGEYVLAVVQAGGAADASALAAASAVDSGYYDETGQVRLDPGQAQQLAQVFASANYPGAVAVVATVNPVQQNQVKVTVDGQYSTFFFKIFGVDHLGVHADSLASVGQT